MRQDIQTQLLNSFPHSKCKGIIQRYDLGHSGAAAFAVRFRATHRSGLEGTYFVKIGDKSWAENEMSLYTELSAAGLSPLLAPLQTVSKTIEGMTAVAYSVAFGYLLQPRPLSSLLEDSARDTTATRQIRYLARALVDWHVGAGTTSEVEILDSQDLLHRMLGERRLSDIFDILRTHLPWWDQDSHFIRIEGHQDPLPNPITFARKDVWESVAYSPPCPIGRIHGDLYSENVICLTDPHSWPKVVDFALSVPRGNPFFDFAYLEYDIMRRTLSVETQADREQWLSFLAMSMTSVLPSVRPSSGLGARTWRLIRPLREQARRLIRGATSSIDREGFETAWRLAGVAAGLNYARKIDPHRPHCERESAMLFAAFALRGVEGLTADSGWKYDPGLEVPWLTVKSPIVVGRTSDEDADYPPIHGDKDRASGQRASNFLPPTEIERLDLLQRLEAYADGKSSWLPGGRPLDSRTVELCQTLYSNLLAILDELLAPQFIHSDPDFAGLSIPSLERGTYGHGLRVAHIMWHIVDNRRRSKLTPVEIALLILGAFWHDLGLNLSAEEREDLLWRSESMWENSGPTLELREMLESLILASRNPAATRFELEEIRLRLAQVEEALIAQLAIARHATRDRYDEIYQEVKGTSTALWPEGSFLESRLSYDGASFYEELVNICEGHDGAALIVEDSAEKSYRQPKLSKHILMGTCHVDVQFVALALRLADMLDFDGERTPPALLEFLREPGHPADFGTQMLSEWKRVASSSNWWFDQDSLVLRAECRDHIVHHALVDYCRQLQLDTHTYYEVLFEREGEDWPFTLPLKVGIEIAEHGYQYFPYTLELDDRGAFSALLHGVGFNAPIHAIGELIKNAVDACMLRDALINLKEPLVSLDTGHRIIIRYEEPAGDRLYPILIVQDTGIGMDYPTLMEWFLRVGQSYYRSSAFAKVREALRARGLDFLPSASSGVGFLSSFLLADRVTVETAAATSADMEEVGNRGDRHLRTLNLDGPTRLIQMTVTENSGLTPFKGTRITLHLARGGAREQGLLPPTWGEVIRHVKDVCQDLPYVLTLEHISDDQVTVTYLDQAGLSLSMPRDLEQFALRIMVADHESCLVGEIALVSPRSARQEESEVRTSSNIEMLPDSALLLNGFTLGHVPGLPHGHDMGRAATARLRFDQRLSQGSRRFPFNKLSNSKNLGLQVAEAVVRIWLSHLIDNRVDPLCAQVCNLQLEETKVQLNRQMWLQRYSALELYLLARDGWASAIVDSSPNPEEEIARWEMSEGGPIPFPLASPRIWHKLLELALPQIANLVFSTDGQALILPPKSNWRQVLDSCHDFVERPVRWTVEPVQPDLP